MSNYRKPLLELKSLRLLLLLVVGALPFLLPGFAAAADPSCEMTTGWPMDKTLTWERGTVLCIGIDVPATVEVFVINVRALDRFSKYDVYMDPVPLKTGQELQTKANRQPVSSTQGNVKLVFTPETLDFGQLYTVALVPRPGYKSGSKVAIMFKDETVIGVPNVPDGFIPGPAEYAADIDPNSIGTYSFDVSCTGNIELNFSLGMSNFDDPDPVARVGLYKPDGKSRWTGTQADENKNMEFGVSETVIRSGTRWQLEVKNTGTKIIKVFAELSTPGDHCPTEPVSETMVFQYSGNNSLASDVTLEQASKSQKHGSKPMCYVDGDDNGGNDRNALLFWDVSAIPDDSTITKATIQLYVTDKSGESYNVYGVKRRWDESAATWNRASNNVSWANGGANGSGDRGKSVGTLGSKNTGTAQINLSPALVQDWVDGDQANYGVLIANPTATDGIDFYCSETSQKSRRPKLVIEYER